MQQASSLATGFASSCRSAGLRTAAQLCMRACQAHAALRTGAEELGWILAWLMRWRGAHERDDRWGSRDCASADARPGTETRYAEKACRTMIVLRGRSSPATCSKRPASSCQNGYESFRMPFIELATALIQCTAGCLHVGTSSAKDEDALNGNACAGASVCLHGASHGVCPFCRGKDAAIMVVQVHMQCTLG